MQIIKWLLKKSEAHVTFCHINFSPFQMDDLMSYSKTTSKFCATVQTTFLKVFEVQVKILKQY